jgi:sporulation protein YlmC with PRC-barrel domain
MELREGTNVYTADGEVVGRISRFVIDPQTQEVTHLVVEKGWLLQEDRVIPTTMIESTGEDRLVLREGSDVDNLPPFAEEHFVNVDEAGMNQYLHAPYGYAPSYYWYPPYGFQGSPSPTAGFMPMELVEREQNIPEGTVPLKVGARVITSNGDHAGEIESLVVDRDTNRTTHFVIAQGVLFKERKLIPEQWVKGIDEDEVRLAAHTRVLERVPAYQDSRA